ncbi:hypothetical protein [Tritonibacter sp. SIMBA_163]|uniref:hypothetical protein n=1 Tax=Tritonibacter sp. SIMBA_163 TaxID=3080868 RepID=UPI003980AD1C
MLKLSAIFFVLLIALGVVGETILPFYGGDRELAARVSKVSFVLLGGIAFAFAQPAIWGWFIQAVQNAIQRSGTKSRMAQTIMRPGLKSTARSAGLGFCCFFLIMTAVLAFQLWLQR